MDLEALGITREELIAQVVAKLCDRIVRGGEDDEDAWESAITAGLERRVQEQIDAAVATLAEKHILPGVVERVDTLVMQETNRWGESTGKALTFREYLVARADAWINEKVTYDGKKPDHYSKAQHTRIAHLIHEHLHYEISRAIKDALETFDSKLSESLRDTIKLKLDEFRSDLAVTVKPTDKPRRR